MSTHTEIQNRIAQLEQDIADLEADGGHATLQHTMLANYKAELANTPADEPACDRSRALTARPKAGAAASNQYGTFAVSYATPKQTAYIKHLMDTRDLSSAELDVDELRQQVANNQVNKKAASAIIKALLALPEASQEQPQVWATDKQKAFARTLLAERVGNPSAEMIRTLLNEAREQNKLTAGVLSTAIEGLLQLPKNVEEAPKPTSPTVPDGRYAIPADDGHYVFYRVNTPTEGKWAGYTFCVQLIGSVGDWTEQRLSRQVANTILGRIAADVEEAARMFGIKAKACGYCCSPLSNVQSRAAGYGETCATKNGHYYPTVEEATTILAERGE